MSIADRRPIRLAGFPPIRAGGWGRCPDRVRTVPGRRPSRSRPPLHHAGVDPVTGRGSSLIPTGSRRGSQWRRPGPARYGLASEIWAGRNVLQAARHLYSCGPQDADCDLRPHPLAVVEMYGRAEGADRGRGAVVGEHAEHGREVAAPGDPAGQRIPLLRPNLARLQGGFAPPVGLGQDPLAPLDGGDVAGDLRRADDVAVVSRTSKDSERNADPAAALRRPQRLEVAESPPRRMRSRCPAPPPTGRAGQSEFACQCGTRPGREPDSPCMGSIKPIAYGRGSWFAIMISGWSCFWGTRPTATSGPPTRAAAYWTAWAAPKHHRVRAGQPHRAPEIGRQPVFRRRGHGPPPGRCDVRSGKCSGP
ncbi:hypothetical protein FRUB_07525 [Fimbriiglobus ruber]|uniref:Uncharacterized protein n=1 Tax=Fimbriiglobus ruber TaxID=1908690 RepID=A0A225DPV8_9BACT|nr:hypothetical protein FRUB_07525 [Fimbriiglobus ruber]